MNFINNAQSVCLKTYSEGEFAHLLESKTEEEFIKGYTGCGDTLLTFLLIELADKEDCSSAEVGAQRVGQAITQLQDVLAALEEA